LGCGNNNFSSFALNTLFGTLHSNTITPPFYFSNKDTKEVSIGGNFGSDGCDISIAENKGWKVYKSY
jgi:hypothetical protein